MFVQFESNRPDKPFSTQHWALEMIYLQNREFGQKIQAILSVLKDKILQGVYHSERIVRDSKELKHLSKLIFDERGMRVEFVTHGPLAAVLPFYINKHHIFIPQWFRGLFEIKDQEVAMANFLNKKGSVDREKAKLSGIFSQYTTKVFMNYTELFKGMEFTTAEVTAILLHELGHAFYIFEYSDRIDSTNQILAKVADHLATEKDNPNQEYVYTELKKLKPDIDQQELEKLCSGNRIIAGWRWYKFVVEMDNQHDRHQLRDYTYDRTTFEMLADNFAARFGYGEELLVALDKLHTSGNDPQKYLGWLVMWQIIVAGYFAMSVFAMFAALSSNFVLAAFVGFLIYAQIFAEKEDSREYTYDDLRLRYKRVRQQFVEMLKDLQLSKEEVKDVLDNIATADKLISETYEYRNLFAAIGNLFSSDARYAKSSISEQQMLEVMANNDLFIEAAKLRTRF